MKPPMSPKNRRGWIKALLIPWGYLFLSAVISAGVSYPLYRLFGEGDLSFFRSLVSRMGQGLLLLGLIPISRWLVLKRPEFGLKKGRISGISRGFGLGVFTLSLHGLLLIFFGVRTPNIPEMGLIHLAAASLAAAGAGFGVALLEETLFRGALIAILMRIAGPRAAILISAFDYAALHFIGTFWTTDPAKVSWDTGFRIAMDGFSHLPSADPGSFLALFLAGILLGTTRLLFRGGLYFSIGLHAGWVFVIKIFKPLTLVQPHSPLIFLIGTYDQVIGYLSCSWVCLLLTLIYLNKKRFQP